MAATQSRAPAEDLLCQGGGGRILLSVELQEQLGGGRGVSTCRQAAVTDPRWTVMTPPRQAGAATGAVASPLKVQACDYQQQCGLSLCLHLGTTALQ